MSKRRSEKKKRDELEAARVFADFVASFDGEETPGSKTFVLGGAIPGNVGPMGGTKRSLPPSFVPAGGPPPKKAKTADSIRQEIEKAKMTAKVRLAKESKTKKPRAMDTMLLKIKQQQAEREAREKEREALGIKPQTHKEKYADEVRELGEPVSTNLYIGNLSATAQEMDILKHFGQFGPIASAKIMYPWTPEEKARRCNSGFVSFMEREHAEKALDRLDGTDFYGMELKLGWGKAVPLPPHPIYVAPSHATPGKLGPATLAGATPTIVGGPGGGSGGLVTGAAGGMGMGMGMGGGAGRGVAVGMGMGGGMGGPQGGAVPGMQGAGAPNVKLPNIFVQVPSDPKIAQTIDRMATFVHQQGPQFEGMVMERERANPEFKFLFEIGSPDNNYYIWKVYSLNHGGTAEKWSTDPVQMQPGGPLFIPPPPIAHHLPAVAPPTKLGAPPPPTATLSEAELDKFEDMLRELTTSRKKIREAMGYALDHAECANEIVELIVDSLVITETPWPVKLARLYLVHDILHNSAAPVRNASSFRTGFQEGLLEVFENLNEAYRAEPSRDARSSMRDSVLFLLDAWAFRAMFPEKTINSLRNAFLKGLVEFEHKPTPGVFSGTSTPVAASKDEDIDGEPLNLVGYEDPDLDGEPL